MDKQVLVFYLGGEAFGVDISRVRTVRKEFSLRRLEHTRSAPTRGEFTAMGEPGTLVDLSEALDLPAAVQTDRSRLVVLDEAGGLVGILVDRVNEVVRIREDQITPRGIHQSHPVEGTVRVNRRLITLLDLSMVVGIPVAPFELYAIEV